MKSTRLSLYSSLFVSVILSFMLYYILAYHGDFVAHNIIFNNAIAFFDVVVLIYAFYTIFYVAVGMAQWGKVKGCFPREGAEPKLRGGMRLLQGRLQDLISFDEGERIAAVSLVSKALDWRVNFIFYAAGTVISLGLLGTFYGLTQTMDGIRGAIDVLSGQDEIDSKLLISSLATPLGGMATAFSASMFGLTSSIGAGLLAHFMARATDGWVYDIEKWSVVASGENIDDEGRAIDPTSHAINRLAAIFSRHVGIAREDNQKFIEVVGDVAKGQVAQKQILEDILKSLQIQDSQKQILEDILKSLQMQSDVSKASIQYISRSAEAAERNNETAVQTVAQVSQVRVEFVNSIETLFQKLSQVEKHVRTIEQQASLVALNGDEQRAANEAAAQVLRVQQQAIIEGMRDLTEARVSIVSAANTVQKTILNSGVKE